MIVVAGIYLNVKCNCCLLIKHLGALKKGHFKRFEAGLLVLWFTSLSSPIPKY